MSEQPNTNPERLDPHFDEAAANIAVSLVRVMDRYQAFIQDEEELQLTVYKPDRIGVYEPSLHHHLFIQRQIDLTDNPATAETTNYHLWVSNDRTGSVSADMDLRLPFKGGQPEATLHKGSIHAVDNALNSFIEAKGL